MSRRRPNFFFAPLLALSFAFFGSQHLGSQAKERHWSYVSPRLPELPKVSNPDWCKLPIDRFVMAEMDRRGLKPNPPAPPEVWLRRVSFDLIGLPPGLDEIDSIVRDDSPESRQLAVERLLKSPHFGERWARHWLDLARYGDSTAIHEDVIRPSWAWRDWVIQAFNEDMPFDRFSIEQLAGDLLPKPTMQQRIATGFHRAAPFNTESGTPKEARRTYQVLDRVNVTGTVWLGATLECAQCHDHKYDPISQKDYYRLYAYFNNTPDEMGKNIGAGRAAMAGPTLKVGGTTTFVMQEMAKPRRTRIFKRGNYETPGENVTVGLPGFLHTPEPDLPKNRLGLARWLVDKANPLTARVTINRWWSEIFGAGLVRTGTDFGSQGEPPTHPELLDWLAVEFMENGWSMKHVLRKIVLSSTYGQSSSLTPEKLASDVDNHFLSRAPRLRLSAEAIRDNALSVAGILSPAMGGPPVYPPQPDGIWWIRDDKSPVYKTSMGEDRYRRSLYTIWRRSYPHPTFSNFDAPNRITCAAERDRTNTPLQALTLLNDPIYLEAALGFARRMSGESAPASIEERIRKGFRLATAREPEAKEVALLADLFNSRLERFLKDAQADVGQWWYLGPFKAKTFDEAFVTRFAPEQEKDIDVKKVLGVDESWQARPEWTDGKVHSLLKGDNSAHYLYREIDIPFDLTVELSLGSNDGVMLFLNNEEIFRKKVFRAAAPDQEKIELSLLKGKNRLLLKIVNGGDACGFYFKPALSGPLKAHKLIESVRGKLAAGISPVNPSAAAELAAWFHVASVLLNLDETITKG